MRAIPAMRGRTLERTTGANQFAGHSGPELAGRVERACLRLQQERQFRRGARIPVVTPPAGARHMES